MLKKPTKANLDKKKAKPGMIWVCSACGKTAQDPYNGTGGWDVSCFIHAILCEVGSLKLDEHGHVINATAVEEK